ncbi:olfactory receptor 11A1-like [Salarias fasciatus]|uniref:olfactory receptor 11A1-like n=1 Tax=Salarias fasciatus TaxID=181472 RepID=UPI001176D27D|nr:olfactory receptor 11A1-like [Salarias fasciatus]
MLNRSFPVISFFVLGGYEEVGTLRYFFFLAAVTFYTVIVISNLLLILVICVNRTLHEPMYLFLLSLFVNELYGSSGLFPLLLVQVLSDSHTVSAPLCFLQIFVIYSYANMEFLNLAVMSYDRYLAICRPLRYGRLMTPDKVLAFVLSCWLYSVLRCVVTISLNLRLPLCGNVLNSLYCQNFLIVRLTCSDSRVNNVLGLIGIVLSVGLPLLAIVISYAEILKVCFGGSEQMRQKALSTCTPHLVSLLNFSFGCCFEILQSRFDMSHVPGSLRVLLSLYFLLMQPLLTPVLYGMQMSKIRKICKNTFQIKVWK